MALTSYMSLTGNNQGDIQGDCTQKGREQTILVYDIKHEIEIPRDTHTGLPTGQRIHHPLIITKRIDNSSPKLMQACTTGEQFSKVQVDFYQINPNGAEELYYQITLSNAIIVKMKNNKPMTFLPENKPYHDMEEVWFTYEKIVWSHKTANVESDDDWKNPSA